MQDLLLHPFQRASRNIRWRMGELIMPWVQAVCLNPRDFTKGWLMARRRICFPKRWGELPWFGDSDQVLTSFQAENDRLGPISTPLLDTDLTNRQTVKTTIFWWPLKESPSLRPGQIQHSEFLIVVQELEFGQLISVSLFCLLRRK